jgi:ribosomal protein S18 acetylase RimI-like enzyme
MEKIKYIPYHQRHQEQVRSLLCGVLPVPLPRLSQRLAEAYHRDADLGLAYAAVYQPTEQLERVVGVILARLESISTALGCSDGRIYIDALAVDGVFQGQHIGTRLLERILVPSLSNGTKIQEVYLHTPWHNQELITFYCRCGLVPSGEVIENYYPRRWVRPPHALVMRWRPEDTGKTTTA